MLRGCEKRMIRMRCPESPLFEEVYFILKEAGSASSASMLEEANRILREGGQHSEGLPARRRGREWLLFFAGATLSAALAVLIYLAQLL